MAVNWRTLNAQPGDWICTEHGIVTPAYGVIPGCPECLRPAVQADIGRDGQLTYRQGSPPYCDSPARHRLLPGQYLLGWTPCLCTPHGGHNTWTCQMPGCDSRLVWPPHDPTHQPSGGEQRLAP